MKILLDESVPQKLRLFIEGGHTVATAWFQGWSGFKNGALLECSGASELRFVNHRGSGVQVPAKSEQPENRVCGVKHEQLELH
jgi:hypothetical protein